MIVVLGSLFVWIGIAASRRPALANVREAASGDHSDDLLAELRKVGSGIDQLGRRVATLEARTNDSRQPQAAPAPSAKAEGDHIDEGPEPTPQEKAEREQRAFASYFGVLDQKRSSERTDDQLQRATDDRARLVIENTAETAPEAPKLSGSHLTRVDCGTTLCRIEALQDSKQAQEDFQVWFLRGMQSNASLWNQDGKTVVYVARQGQTLPVWHDVLGDETF